MSTKVRTRDFADRKRRREKIAMLTAYDSNMARLLDRAGIDAMVHHTAAVSRVTERAMVVADMPFLTYQSSVADAVRNAGRLMREGGAEAVKLEGGAAILDVVKRLVDVGVPVMGHLGLLPQSVHQVGGFIKQARTLRDADILLADAIALEEAGAFAVVLEAIPSEVARTVTEAIGIPTVGIGAGPDCDGQILVCNDMLGLTEPVPSFVTQYARLAGVVASAAESYVEDVKAGRFARPAGTPTTTSTT